MYTGKPCLLFGDPALENHKYYLGDEQRPYDKLVALIFQHDYVYIENQYGEHKVYGYLEGEEYAQKVAVRLAFEYG